MIADGAALDTSAWVARTSGAQIWLGERHPPGDEKNFPFAVCLPWRNRVHSTREWLSYFNYDDANSGGVFSGKFCATARPPQISTYAGAWTCRRHRYSWPCAHLLFSL